MAVQPSPTASRRLSHCARLPRRRALRACPRDNLIHGDRLSELMRAASARPPAPPSSRYRVGIPSVLWASSSSNPRRHGSLSIEESPRRPRADWAVIGALFLPTIALSTSRPGLEPSARGRLEITDPHRELSEPRGRWHVERLGAAYAWSIPHARNPDRRPGIRPHQIEKRTAKNDRLRRRGRVSVSALSTGRRLSAAGNAHEQIRYGRYLLRLADEVTRGNS